MHKNLLAFCALILAAPASAQFGGPGASGGGAPEGGEPGGRAPRMKDIKPVTRERFDKIVTNMFRNTDQNDDGLVTTTEVRAIASARRDVLIGERFEWIDANGDRAISRDEFFEWQRGLGSLAQSDEARAIGRDAPVPETIDPDFGNKMEGRLLLGLIEPLNTVLVAKANLDYDTGLSLAELIAHEGKCFDEADRDRNGAISTGEAHQPQGRLPGGVQGLPPSRPPQGNP